MLSSLSASTLKSLITAVVGVTTEREGYATRPNNATDTISSRTEPVLSRLCG